MIKKSTYGTLLLLSLISLIANTADAQTRQLGVQGNQGQSRAQTLFNALDANRDGVITEQEMRDAMRAFSLLDKNQDGRLTQTEAGMNSRAQNQTGNQPMVSRSNPRHNRILPQVAGPGMGGRMKALDTEFQDHDPGPTRRRDASDRQKPPTQSSKDNRVRPSLNGGGRQSTEGQGQGQQQNNQGQVDQPQQSGGNGANRLK